jgi:hypothetical protein
LKTGVHFDPQLNNYLSETNVFEIEKDIPVPPARNKVTYPFADMEVGDSFFVPCDPDGVLKTERRVSAAAAQYRRRMSVKFVTRREETGVRVWRAE